MQPRSPRIVELLNEALTYELSITNTYFLHGRMLDAWGLPRLGQTFYKRSIEEMKDADALIQRILLFEGHPNLQKLLPIRVGESALEILDLGLAAEIMVVTQFNDSAQECRDLGDHATASIFDEMARDEETHADWFEAQLQAIANVGIENYLAEMVDPS